MKIDKIVIVGGGTAGWMTATHLQCQFNDKEIVVIESPDFPTVGVGESTLQHMRIWTYANCLEDEDWMPHCDASYKVSIKFTDWDGEGTSFHYPFGAPVIHNPDDPALWTVHQRNEGGPVEDFAKMFFPATHMAEEKKLIAEGPNWHYKADTAYHFDATKFGLWLKENKCCNVTKISGTVETVHWDGEDVKSLTLTDGSEIDGDIFIDCTGWKSLLSNNKFNDYSEFLPNNKAWATQIPGESDSLVTECTTLGNGWVWNIPTASRVGTGYVYSDKYVSDDEALAEFKEHLGRDDLEFRNLTMRIGRHDCLAKGNVAFIGMSYGFIEPLESNGLFTVLHNLYHLEKAIRSKWTGGALDAINITAADEFDGFAAFVQLHYKFAARCDTPYWKDASSRKLMPDHNHAKVLLEQTKNEYVDLNIAPGVACILMGNHWNPGSKFETISNKMFAKYDLSAAAAERIHALAKNRDDWQNLVWESEEVPRRF